MPASALEPNALQACQGWPDLRNIWTPIGWKDHLFRFNVLFNGTLLAKPDLNRRTEAWKGQGVQVAFVPSCKEALKGWPASLTHDDGMTRQGWQDGPAPVLWTE